MTSLPEGFFARPIAHRALHGKDGRPENSRAALKAACMAGVGIELDLQLSADGVAMVFHDDTLDRLTETTGRINDRPAAALTGLRLVGGGRDETIPKLTDALDIVAGHVPLLLELKDQTGKLAPDTGALAHATLAALAGYAGPVAMMSFNPHIVVDLAARAPDIPRGLTTCGFLEEDWPQVCAANLTICREMQLLEKAGASFISHKVQDLASPWVARAKEKGMAVACWTVRDPATHRRALKIADCVTFEGYTP